jgi:hypothetical protein
MRGIGMVKGDELAWGIGALEKRFEEHFDFAAQVGVAAASAVEIAGSLRDRFLAARGNKDRFDLRRVDDGDASNLSVCLVSSRTRIAE